MNQILMYVMNVQNHDDDFLHPKKIVERIQVDDAVVVFVRNLMHLLLVNDVKHHNVV